MGQAEYSDEEHASAYRLTVDDGSLFAEEPDLVGATVYVGRTSDSDSPDFFTVTGVEERGIALIMERTHPTTDTDTVRRTTESEAGSVTREVDFEVILYHNGNRPAVAMGPSGDGDRSVVRVFWVETQGPRSPDSLAQDGEAPRVTLWMREGTIQS